MNNKGCLNCDSSVNLEPPFWPQRKEMPVITGGNIVAELFYSTKSDRRRSTLTPAFMAGESRFGLIQSWRAIFFHLFSLFFSLSARSASARKIGLSPPPKEKCLFNFLRLVFLTKTNKGKKSFLKSD